ncbi:Na+ driven multidrug efflux pump [Shigella dysenteriae 1617]|uniref:Na+ driven multidrug efflux pump n=1 Tax=Shigella dysenteriae 1617 TaxID=754093 RepID=A0A0A6ZVD3_SHIDY|nr:Na+ driven multidrug efflux pump [Shigella dysenteriae 1617]
MRHILTAKNLLSNPIFKFPNCLPFLSTVCCICRQFVGENLCSFADSPSLFEMWFHFLVVVAFSLGKRDRRRARVATRQSLVIMTLFAVLLATLIHHFGEQIIDFVAGDATTEVKALALTYLELTVLSYPAAAITLIGSGALRGAGNTKIPLLINGSLNILNIIISGILIYGLFSWPGRRGWVGFNHFSLYWRSCNFVGVGDWF